MPHRLNIAADVPMKDTARIYPEVTCKTIVERMNTGVPITIEARSKTDDPNNPVKLENTLGVVEQSTAKLTEDGFIEFEILWAISDPENDPIKKIADMGKLDFSPLGKGKLFEDKVIEYELLSIWVFTKDED